jgi:4-carboxymuconolactone decarboxylase
MALKRSDRYQRGLKKIKELYGDVWNVNFLDDLSPEMNDYTVECLYSDVYNTDKLDARSREISIISILIALRANSPLSIHMHGALNVGLIRKELIEVIVQSSIYAGFPAAVNAMEIAREVFRERDHKGETN